MIIAGQCSMDKYFLETSREVARLGATHIRAGLFKPRSSPNRWSGWGNENEEMLRLGLEQIREIKETTGKKIVAEAMNPKQIEILYDYIDIFQVGSRNQQDSELLKEFGKQDKPVLLKRGFATTIEEFVMAADFIGDNVILCERGVRSFETYTRNTFDIACIPAVKGLCDRPIIADPSHAAGMNELVIPLALASIVAGADGLMIEVHCKREEAKTDGPQSLTIEQFEDLMIKVKNYG